MIKKENSGEVGEDLGNIQTGLSPIIKWAGGKEKELKYIIPNLPKFGRFFEPFVGGGSVFMGIKAKEYHINDYSSELMELYKNISEADEKFFHYAEEIDRTWENASEFFLSSAELVDKYKDYRQGTMSKDELKEYIETFCARKEGEILDMLGGELSGGGILGEVKVNLFRKMTRMRDLDIERHELSEKDLIKNMETAIKSAVYMNYRNMYNDKEIWSNNDKLHCALFLFIRNYAYSGMFRYSGKGEFNVPYGGTTYNGKSMSKKLSYYRSESLLNHFGRTKIYNMDFEDFLRKTQPKEDDFVFLDPPYDSKFSTYAQNTFTKEDQERLAGLMIKECRAKWMMIIKNTEFIYNLYNKDGINIRRFDKEYMINFMNRNDKKVTHLLITNY